MTMRKDIWANLPKYPLLVGILSLGMGTTASILFPGGGIGTPLMGSTAGALIGGAVANKEKEQQKTQIQEYHLRLQNLEKQLDTQYNWDKYKTRLIGLKEQVESFEKKQSNLGEVEGKLSQKQAELQEVKTRLNQLTQQRQDLENRVNSLNQNYPNLSELEQLKTQLGQLRLEKSQLEGEITALRWENQRLEGIQRSLQEVQANYSVKNSELQQLIAEILEKKEQAKALEQKTVELELIRATYDGLSQEKKQFETKINHLRPEIDRLEAEKQRIIQEIQNNTLDYRQIEQFKQKLRNLGFELREKESQKRDVEQQVQELEGQRSILQGEIEALRRQQQKLKQEINQVKGQIETYENTAESALRSLREPLLWKHQDLPKQECNVQEDAFLSGFIQHLQTNGLSFSRRVVYGFHTALKVQDISALVILAGISGTGKSELPQQYADFIGAQRLILAVQPRWDSPQDLQGFYNYVEKKFKPTELMRGLYQYNHDRAMNNRLVMVLLDEMNLARVEYYFSDFLSKLETRRSRPTYLEIDLGSLPIREEERRLKIPEQFLFVGTMNEDETTQTLSDKVLDRANVLTFGKPKTLQLRRTRTTQAQRSFYVGYSQFQEWFKQPDEASSGVLEQIKVYLDQVNNIMESLGHPFAHRVYQGISQYVINYPGVVDTNSEAFRLALADQFAQKLLPKLRGIMIEDYPDELDQFANLIQQLGDSALIDSFKKARLSSSGQFEWKGLVYPEE